MRSLPFLLLSALSSSLPVLAEPTFTSPAAGDAISPGTITISWKDGGSAPSLSDITSYQLLLFTGSNANPFQLADLKSGSFTEGNSVSATISPGLAGASAKHAYFIGMIATTAQGTIKVFSDRFALKGMTGVFPASVEADLAGVSGTAGPPPVNVHIGERQAAAGAAAGVEASFAIPYPLQDGPTKYAPMQPVPGTKITATNTAPLYPTSSVSLASTFLPIPTVVTTVTQSQTFVAASHANTAAAASQPTDPMQKFLNRWKD